MQKISYGFMNPNDGCFLHVFHYENDPDDGGMGTDFEFNLDKFEPIYETEDPAALLDTMIGTQNGRYLSQEVISMAVRLVRFDNTSDPASLWLDDIENRFDPNPNTGHQLGIR